MNSFSSRNAGIGNAPWFGNADTNGASATGARDTITTIGGIDMLKRTAVPLLVLLIVAMSGCASSDGSKMAAMAPADVGGVWQGGTGARVVTMVLSQTGTNVKGALSGAGSNDGPLSGTVDGNTVRLQRTSGFAGTALLTIQGDVITGPYDGETLNLRRVAADVNGRWTGYYGTAQGDVVTMNLNQAGQKVTGDIDIARRADLSGPITGAVRGHTIELDLRSGYASAPLLTVKGNQITGVVGAGPVNLTRSP